jgi:hypothetical protein
MQTVANLFTQVGVAMYPLNLNGQNGNGKQEDNSVRVGVVGLFKVNKQNVVVFIFIVTSVAGNLFTYFSWKADRQQQLTAEAKVETPQTVVKGPDSPTVEILKQSVKDLSGEVLELKKDATLQKKELTEWKATVQDFCDELKDEIPDIQPADTKRIIRNAVKKIENRLKPVSKAEPAMRADEILPSFAEHSLPRLPSILGLPRGKGNE